MNYNSEDPDADPIGATMHDVFQHMIDAPIHITYDALGAVVSMEGMDEILEKMQAGSGAMGGNMMGGGFNQNITTYFPIFPEGEIAIGDSWETESASEMQGLPIKMKNTYTLKNVNDGIAFIELESEYELNAEDMDEEAMAAMGIDPSMAEGMEMEMNGEMAGVLKVDVATGWTNEGPFEGDIDMKMAVMGMEMPMDMKMKVNIKPQ